MNLDDQALVALMQSGDKNRDGVLSFDEFYTLVSGKELNPQQQQQLLEEQKNFAYQPPPQQQQMMMAMQAPQPIPVFQQQQYAPMMPPGYGPYIAIQPWQPLPIPLIQENKVGKISDAKIELMFTGVKSNDAKLSSKEELEAFFATYAVRPQVLITVLGYHHETRSSGSGKNRTTHTVNVTDFRYTFELSPYVFPGTLPADRDTIYSNYLASGNNLKRISMHKRLLWNFDPLRLQIEARIRQLGWRRQLTVSLDVVKPEAKVENGSDFSKCLRHPCTDVLCVMTCMCLFYYPFKWCYQADFSFVTDYQVSVTPDDFFQAIYPQIRCWR